MSKVSHKVGDEDMHVLGEPNGLYKLIFVINECSNEWTQDSDFRRFAINKMKELFEECGERECEQYFNFAYSHQFIKKEISEKKNMKTRFILNSNHKMNVTHDWFCFDCDKLVQMDMNLMKCDYCWRVFHRKCLNSDPINDVYKCAYCKLLTADKEGFIGQQIVDNQRLNTLIEYLLDFLKTKMKEKYDTFVMKYDLIQSMAVFKEMDLSLMKEKAVMTRYKSLNEFENDFVLFMHNLIITTHDLNSIQTDFLNLKEFYKKELKELRICVDCYERSNDKRYQEVNKDWFCIPCEPPHELLFVKVKGFPYWPAKKIQDYGDGRYNVRFFDKGLRRMDVKDCDCFPIDNFKIRESIKNNTKLTEPLKMLDKYQTKLNKSLSNLDKCIENVVQTAYERKSPRFHALNQNSLSLKSATIKKSANPVPFNSKLFTTIKTPVTAQSIGLNDSHPVMKSLSFNESSVPKVALLVVTESTVLSSKKLKKRRSNKKSTPSPKVAKDLLNEQTIPKENFDKTPQNVSESEPMDFEANKEVLNTEEPLKAFNTNDDHSSTANSQSMLTSMSLDNNFNTQTDAQNNHELRNTDINVISNSSSRINQTNDSQKIESHVIKDTDLKPDEEKMVITAENPEFDESSKNINSLFDELLTSGETNSNVKQKIICIKYYHENQIKALEKKFKETREELAKELVENKKKNWCAMCEKSAKFYCCVRFYCSVECQRNDWQNGHSKQCLTLITT